MKKLIPFIFLLSFCSNALAARVVTQTIISSTLLDDSPTSATGTAPIKAAERVALFVTYDETEVGNSVSAAVTVDVSWDNSTWLDASFYDYAGGATLQTSESIAADGNYYLWFNRDVGAPFFRVVITGTNTDADDTAAVAAYLVTTE